MANRRINKNAKSFDLPALPSNPRSARTALHVGASALNRLLSGRPREHHIYDVAVIGTGAGGGALGHQLHCAGIDTLMIEAGGSTGGSDFLNLSQRLQSRANCRTLYEALALRPNLCSAGSGTYVGGSVHILGGKTRLWGGLCPRPRPWELACFPKPVSSYLADEDVFRRAEDLMRVSTPASPFQHRVRSLLESTLPGWCHEDAPYAVRTGSLELAGPSGMYCSADLIVEDKLARLMQRRKSTVDVALNYEVRVVSPSSKQIVEIYADSRANGEPKRFIARNVVLAAGTLGSARIAKRSGLSESAGVGVTDHPILYTRFGIPAGTKFHHPDAASKTVSQHLQASTEAHRYNMLLELGTGINDLQFGHVNVVPGTQYMCENLMISEVVFILHAPLNPENKLTVDSNGNTCLQIRDCAITNEELEEMQMLATKVVSALGGHSLKGENLTLKVAALGCVAHEVGSLAMGRVVDENCCFTEYPNVYAGDLSILPASLAANPTLTLTALATRLGNHLTRKVG